MKGSLSGKKKHSAMKRKKALSKQATNDFKKPYKISYFIFIN